METFEGMNDELKRLETAADVILAPPTEVSAERRKEAEALFITIRNNRIAPAICRYILETSQNSFVMFEVTQLMGNTILKEWTTTEKPLIEESFKFLLKYVAERPSLPNFVRAEVLHTIAKMFKRGMLDGKCGGSDALCSIVSQLFSSEDSRIQALGCELVDAVATEFSTSWRGANFGITWDFHFRARKAFEANGLRQLFELSLQMLSTIANEADLSNEYQLTLCGKFLRLAESVLSWSFFSRLYPPCLSYCTELYTATTFRPPKSWSRILQNQEILIFFFKLHSIVRNRDCLCKISINVLVQLASLTGDVFGAANSSTTPSLMSSTSSSSPSAITSTLSTADQYITVFIKNFLDIFSNGLHEEEISGICLIIYKLFTYQKLAVLASINEEVLSTFLLYIVQFLEDFAPVAMQRALHDDDQTFRENLQQVYEAWAVLIKATYRNQFSYPLHELTFRILSSFVQNLFSPPIGNRKDLPDTVDDDTEQDDRIVFADIFTVIAQFAVFCVRSFLPMVITVFQQKLEEFVRIIDGDSSISIASWQEDMHWLFLLIGFSFTEEDLDGVSHLPSKLIEYSVESMDNSQYHESETHPYIVECLRNPRGLNSRVWKPYPLIQTAGLVLAWNALDHELLTKKGAEHISPGVSRSALWCGRRILSSLGVHLELEDDPLVCVPNIGVDDTEFSRFIIDFILHRTFAILNGCSSETKLCIDAVGLFVGFAETRPAEFASSDLMYSCLAGIQLDRLPARRMLIRSLVQIGVSVENGTLQKLMSDKILRPLAEKFHSLSANSTSNESDIVDLLDCFCGVADSAEHYSAQFLFCFLSPVLSRSIELLSSQSQLLTDAILELFSVVTCKLAVHVDDRENTVLLYQMLLDLLKMYQKYQLGKYKTMIIDDEDKVSDIVLFLDILANIMSKDLLLSAVNNDQNIFDCGSKAALSGLEILVPLLEERMLSFPTLCTKFYRLIMYFSEMAPRRITEMSEQMIHSIIELLRVGLQSQFGQEVAVISVTTVNHLATHFANNPDVNSNLIKHLSTLLECTFSLCLEASCQVHLLGEATHALYALICCNPAAFDELVRKLLCNEQNASARAQLETSFNTLLQSAHLLANRREKREFRDRFEKFLTTTQGLLVIN